MSSRESEKNCASGKRLKEERERIGLSQEEFGLKLDTTKRTVVNWEAGKSAPNVFDLILMGFSLGIDTNYVVRGERTPLGVADGGTAYSPAEQASAAIRTMKLAEKDAEMITAIARRLSDLNKNGS